MKPDFNYERQFWRKGFSVVIGIDEVGRGCFAGPVVAAAVAFAPISNLKLKIENLGINDSKLLKPKEREQLAYEIKKYALAWDVTEVGVSVINRIGIGRATQKAMRKAVGDIARLKKKKTKKQYSNIAIQQYTNLFVLVDGFHIRYLRGFGLRNQKAIKKGDQKSISIAAASILAKVYRDKLMQRLSKKYPRYEWGRNKQSLFRATNKDIYGWARNKGYGTKEHQKAIKEYGLTRYHRKEFVKNLFP